MVLADIQAPLSLISIMYPSGEAGTFWLVSWSRMGFPFRGQRGSLLSISPNMGMEVVSDDRI